MPKRDKVSAVHYDEASSGSDDDVGDSSDEESSTAYQQNRMSLGKSRQNEDEKSSSSSDSASSSDSDNDSENSDSEGASSSSNKVSGDSIKDKNRQDSDASSSEDEDENEDEDRNANLTLQERLQQKEGKGPKSLRNSRERKRSALEVASKRLAKMKKQKKTDTDGEIPQNRKKSKHAPAEVSSKRSEFYRRGPMRLNESGLGVEIGANRYKPLDPRTSSLSGHLNEEHFDKNYEFLQDIRNIEISQLKKRIAARKLTGKKGQQKRRKLNISDGNLEEDEDKLRQLKQEKADFERRKVNRAAKQSVKRKIRTEVEEGKRGAYFLKRKEMRRLEFEAKMEELQKRGGKKAVEKAMEKRRRKAKSRDASLFAK